MICSPQIEFRNSRSRLRGTLWVGCRYLSALLVATHVIGCGDEDRVVTARCQAVGDVFLLHVEPSDTGSIGVIRFNGRKIPVGAVLRVGSEVKDGRDRWNSVYTLIDTPYSELHELYWISGRIKERMKIEVDGGKMDSALLENIEPVLLAGSRLAFYGVDRRVIPDAVYAVNRDPGAVSILQNGMGHDRYVVVSSVITGKQAELLYDPRAEGLPSTPEFSLRTFRLGNIYFHVNYDCAPMERIASMEPPGNVAGPVFYSYTGVRYDETTRSVERDLRPIELEDATAL